MNFSFGIITNGSEDFRINQIIDSIEKQNIASYEIIIVGNSKVKRKNTQIIEFDESILSAWITKKKNIITEIARFENIVYLHDYIELADDWYVGFLKFGDNFDVCMNKITNCDGTRYRDWFVCIWDNPVIMEIAGPEKKCLIPYDENRFVNHMKFSGAYWVAKKKVMLDVPLDESLTWNDPKAGEDYVWSKQIREKYTFSMNSYSEVKLIKSGKDRVYGIADSETIKRLEEVLLK
jgi:hypothetical protein